MVKINSTRLDLYFLKIMEFSHYNEYGVSCHDEDGTPNVAANKWKVSHVEEAQFRSRSIRSKAYPGRNSIHSRVVSNVLSKGGTSEIVGDCGIFLDKELDLAFDM